MNRSQTAFKETSAQWLDCNTNNNKIYENLFEQLHFPVQWLGNTDFNTKVKDAKSVYLVASIGAFLVLLTYHQK